MKSLEKALSAMDYIISAEGRYVSLTDLSRKLNLPKGTAHRILTTLVKNKYVQRDPHTRKYELGLRFIDIECVLNSRKTLRTAISPLLKQLYSKCEETVSAAVLVEGEIEYVDRYESEMYLRVAINIGTRFPAHCTATGKVMLAALSDEELKRVYRPGRKISRNTEKSIGTYPQLLLALEEVCREGVGRDFEECLIGVHCIAAPIATRENKVIGAVSISGPRERLTIEKMGYLKPLLLETTEKISREFQR
ncbi:MAG: IclR family transcriptional regulator [Syntrophobacteraceae bacterium]